jgi:hypothetical protein
MPVHRVFDRADIGRVERLRQVEAGRFGRQWLQGVES